MGGMVLSRLSAVERETKRYEQAERRLVKTEKVLVRVPAFRICYNDGRTSKSYRDVWKQL